MKAIHFLSMYSYIKECENEFINDTYVTIALQAVKTYIAELFITVDMQSLSEKEFFDRWSSETPVKRRIMRTQAFESLVKEKGAAVIIDDELLDSIAEDTTKALKLLYDTTKPTT